MNKTSQDQDPQRLGPYQYDFMDPEYIKCFVKNGFVIVKQLFPPSLIRKHFKYTSTRYQKFKKDFKKKNSTKKVPVLGISKHIVNELERDPIFDQLIRNKNHLDALEKLLGPDLGKTNSTSIFINDPNDHSPVNAKDLHQEAWSGATVDDIQIWVPFHKTDLKTTMGVIPGSHYYGFLPNRNRKIIIPEGFEMPETLPMHPLEEGDAVLFHGLLLHGTEGRGDHIRYALAFRFRNTFAPLGLYRSIGFTTIRNGPMTRICVGLGNDLLSPLRTYGGLVSNDEEFKPETK